MSEFNLEGIESLHIVRADAHLTISGANVGAAEVDCSVEPRVKREGGRAEVSFLSNGTVRLPAGVTLEVQECAGHLDLEDLTAPVVLGRIAGNLRARRVGAITIRNRIAGNAKIDSAGAIEGGEIAGNARVDAAQSLSIGKVAGNLEVNGIELAASAEKVGGNTFLEKIGGAVRFHSIGGKLYAERVGDVDVEYIGGKVRINDTTGGVRIGKVGGRATVLGAGGEVKIGTIGGHGLIGGISGGVELPDVGGALDLHGPFPAGKFWGAQSRGRISVEVDATASLAVTASSGWGRIRVFGLETGKLNRGDRGRAQGNLGLEKPDTERTRMALETRHADIIFAQAGAQDRDYCWHGRGSRSGRRFGAFDELGEILSEEFGQKIPEFVGSVLGAAGQFVASSGIWSGGFLRTAAEDATRSVRDAMSEAERAFGDLGEKLPRDIASSIEELGRRLSEIIRRAAAEGRGATRTGREEVRDHIREAAVQMRDSIRAAVREARVRRGQTSSPEASHEPAADDASRTRPFTRASSQGDIMDILNAVKEGRIQPNEADEMIAALMEVERATESRGSEGR